MSDLIRELGRKAFHMLSLAYLAAYHLIGYPRVAAWLLAWSVLVVAVETARLYLPRMNGWLFSLFGDFSREEERRRVSGIFHTTLGALLLILLFGDRPRLIEAGLLCVALGDAAAALAGKAFGRHKLGGGKKSLEGSLACFLVCAGVGRGLGFGPVPLVLAALAATAIELVPTSLLFNDNLWIPVGTAAVLSFFP